MAQYGGFDPGTFEAWALNLFNTVFVKEGVARGLQVIPTNPASMAVQVTLDGVYGDGVCFLSNGCWFRIDQVVNLSISSNSTGSTRTDAVVVTVDPTGATSASIAVSANWSTGFTPGTNQFVVALISVPSGATGIASGNITMNSATASITGTGGSSNSMVAADGYGLAVQDATASSIMTVVMTGLTTGIGRSLVLQTTDTSAIGHGFTFDPKGNFTALNTIQATAGVFSALVTAAGFSTVGMVTASTIIAVNFTTAGQITASSFNGSLGGGIKSYDNGTYGITGLNTQEPSGSGRGYLFQTWDGMATHNAFSIGSSGSHGSAWVDDSGNITAPSFSGGVKGGTGGAGFGVNDNGSSIILGFDQYPLDRNLALQGWVNGGGYYSGIYTLIDNAGQFFSGTMDNNSSKSSRLFSNTTDPATYTTVNEGDWWADG